jgi:hypothetical protein
MAKAVLARTSADYEFLSLLKGKQNTEYSSSKLRCFEIYFIIHVFNFAICAFAFNELSYSSRLQERAWQKEQGKPVGATLLYFGCRNKAADYIYQVLFLIYYWY